MDPNQFDLFDYIEQPAPAVVKQADAPDPSGTRHLNGFYYEAATQLFVCFSRGGVRHWEGSGEEFYKAWKDGIIKNRSI